MCLTERERENRREEKGGEGRERGKAIVDVTIPLGARRAGRSMRLAVGDLQSERLADGVGLMK